MHLVNLPTRATKGEVDGVPYVVVGKHDKRGPRVGIDAPEEARFRVTRAGRAVRWFRDIGYVTVVRSGDPAFDAAFHAETEDDAWLRAVLADREARAAVAALLDAGCVEVRAVNGRLEARVKPRALRHKIDEAQLREVVARLSALRGRLGVGARPAGRRAWSRGWKIILAVGIAVAVADVALLAATTPPVDVEPLAWLGVLFGSLAALSVTLLVGALAARRTFSHRVLGLTLMVAVPGLAFTGASAAVGGNQLFDDGPSTTHVVNVLKTEARRTSSSRGSAPIRYWAIVESWRPERIVERLQVGRGVHETQPARLRVTSRPGALGYEWLEAVVPVPE